MTATTQTDTQALQAAVPPSPPGADNAARVSEQGLRRSFMEGTWSPTLKTHAIQQIGKKRTAMAGLMDTSSNLVLQYVTQIARLYDSPPTLVHTDKSGLEVLQTHLEQSRCWGLAARNQQWTLALREGLLFAGWHGGDEKDGGRLVVRQVSADFVFGEPHPNDPTQFGLLYEARRRDVLVDAETGRRKKQWTWDVWDVREPVEDAHPASPEANRPSFRILDSNRRGDLTAQFVDPAEWEGAAYPYRDLGNQPVIPAVLYHASPHDGLWAWCEGSEVIFGTLQDGLNWTQVNHGFKVGSFRQRYIAGGRIKGGVVKEVSGSGGDKVETFTADPAVALEIASEGGDAVSVGEWGESVDISKAEQFARNYGKRLAVHFGLSPADVSFEARSPQSGVSLTVSRQGQRKLQAALAPRFREGDLLLLERIAIVLGAHGIKVPQTDFQVEYAAIELSPLERKEELANIREELEMGLTTKVDAWLRLHPGSTEADAKRALKEIAKEIEAENEAAPPSAPAPGAGPEGSGGLDGGDALGADVDPKVVDPPGSSGTVGGDPPA
jgi:hypothetical protein